MKHYRQLIWLTFIATTEEMRVNHRKIYLVPFEI